MSAHTYNDHDPQVVVVGVRDEAGDWHYAASEPMPYGEAWRQARDLSMRGEGTTAFARAVDDPELQTLNLERVA